jgi:hypothetical protein
LIEVGEQLGLVEKGPVRCQLVDFLLLDDSLAADVGELIVKVLHGLFDDRNSPMPVSYDEDKPERGR